MPRPNWKRSGDNEALCRQNKTDGHIGRKKETKKDEVSNEEMHEYRSPAGTLMYMGSGGLLQATYVPSERQQWITRLTLQGLVDADTMLDELWMLNPYITSLKPKNITHIFIQRYEHASHPKTAYYWQIGIV